MSRAMDFLRELAASERRDRATSNDNWAALLSIESRVQRGWPFGSESAAVALADGLGAIGPDVTAGESAGGAQATNAG